MVTINADQKSRLDNVTRDNFVHAAQKYLQFYKVSEKDSKQQAYMKQQHKMIQNIKILLHIIVKMLLVILIVLDKMYNGKPQAGS